MVPWLTSIIARGVVDVLDGLIPVHVVLILVHVVDCAVARIN